MRGELTGTTRSPPSIGIQPARASGFVTIPPPPPLWPCRSWGNLGLECCRAKRQRHHSGGVHVRARHGTNAHMAWQGICQGELIHQSCLQGSRVLPV